MSEIIKRASTYDIIRTFAALMARGEEGFDTDDELAAWEVERDNALAQSDDKLMSCRVVIDKAGADADYLKAEAQRLLDHARRIESVRDRVKSLALSLMLETGKDKVDTLDGSWAKVRRTVTESVNVTDLEWLPNNCVKTTTVADKVEIKKRLKAGESIPGAELVTGESVTIQFGK